MPQGAAGGQNLGCLDKVEYCNLFIQQLLNKEGWASDMFITSTFQCKKVKIIVILFSCSSNFAL